MPKLSQAVRTTIVDGRVYFDLEQMLDIMFDAANASSHVATVARDPALGVMTMGMVNMCRALEAVLTHHKEAGGLIDRKPLCSVQREHPSHNMMIGRKMVRCPGLAETG